MALTHHYKKGKPSFQAELIPPALKLEFDFVVAERVEYVPNSGPPMLPIGIQPIHDLKGVIENVFVADGVARYIVTYANEPAVRLSVRAEKVRDYVSARTLEEWEWKETQLQNEMERDRLKPKAKAKRAREDKLLELKESKEAREAAFGKRKAGRPVKGKGRGGGFGPVVNRKSSFASIGQGAVLGHGILSTISPKNNHRLVQESTIISPRRPIKTTQSKQHGLAEFAYSDVETEEEVGGEEEESEAGEDDNDDSAALDRQLNESPSHTPYNSKRLQQSLIGESGSNSRSLFESSFVTKRSRQPSSSAGSGPPSSLGHESKRPRSFRINKSEPTPSSGATSELFHGFDRYGMILRVSTKDSSQPMVSKVPTKAGFPKHETAAARFRRERAEANLSVFNARYGIEPVAAPSPRLQPSMIPVPNTPNTATSRSSRSKRQLSIHDNAPGRQRSVRSSSRVSVKYQEPLIDPETEEAEIEYAIDCILEEEWRDDVLYYLIRWEGDYLDTWEPDYNVGRGSITKWDEKKRDLVHSKGKKMKSKPSIKEPQAQAGSDNLLVSD